MILYDEELNYSVDLFENDEVVLTKYFFKAKHFDIEKIGVGIKDECGDIVKIVIASEKII